MGCVITQSRVGAGADIGPWAHLRPLSDLRQGVHVGNFVEVKKSVLHEGVKAGHLTYLGDADVGAGTNVGAGTITCNYDGVHKHRTIIGEKAFIGSNTALVAPVTVGAGAYIGAGSTITKEVPPGKLGIARAKTGESGAAVSSEEESGVADKLFRLHPSFVIRSPSRAWAKNCIPKHSLGTRRKRSPSTAWEREERFGNEKNLVTADS